MSLEVTKPKLVRDAHGSRLRALIHVVHPRDLTGDEVDALWARFKLPTSATYSIRRGTIRRRRIVLRAQWDTKV